MGQIAKSLYQKFERNQSKGLEAYRAFLHRENPISRNLATHAFCRCFPFTKAIRNLSPFNKKNLVFLIRNISSKELHSALGKISLVNLMYNLLGLKKFFGLKI